MIFLSSDRYNISKAVIKKMFLEIKHSHENKHWPTCPGFIENKMTLKKS